MLVCETKVQIDPGVEVLSSDILDVPIRYLSLDENVPVLFGSDENK